MLDTLIIAAHPDDAELSVGGTILLLKSKGRSVGVLDLTDGEPTPYGTIEKRRQETEAATQILGLDWRGNLGLPNRSLQADLTARAALAGRIRELRPKTLMTHFPQDAHPDHVAATELVNAARFWAKLTKTDLPGEPHYPDRILQFSSLHLRVHLRPSFVVDISPFHEQKMNALAAYHSQFVEGRPTTPPTLLDDVRARDRYWGMAIRRGFGEAFYSEELVGLEHLDALC